MKIERYISELLYRHQCVTVPGFGAFLSEIQSAYLYEANHSFFPPKKVISFTTHLKNNDGLLANHIAEAEKTSYENAIQAIESEIAIWKSILQVNGNFTLKNIGEIALTAENNLLFTPADNLNYLPEAFGLTTFVSPKILREELKKEVQELEEKAPIQFTPERRKTPAYLKYAAIFVLALTATGSVGLKLYNDQIEHETLLVETAVQKEVQQSIQEATFLIQNPICSVSLPVAAEEMPYHIVAGAFRNEGNANIVLQNLTKQGYPARRLEQNKHGLFPVLYGSYLTYAEAKAAQTEIVKSNPEAWILIKEL
ncbi:MAG: SPOR domain-containing protein [Flavobacterium sp.]|nr:SPOR domain-containing protein [Flavobacterium sp.]